MQRSLVAEALGTGLLMAAVVGSSAMGAQMGVTAEFGLAITSLCCGATLWVLISLLMPVSGGHLNPAVTLLFFLRAEIGGRAALAYGGAQVVGAILGTALAHVMFALPVWQVSSIARDQPNLWLSEAVATFGLIFVIVGALAARGPVAALVGGFVTVGYWVTASSGFSNPAMTIARALTGTAGGLRPVDLPAYLAAQFAGAALAWLIARWLFTPANEKPPARAHGG
ncbi:MAG: aquaporin [Paracoccaceae bacterium]